MRKFAFALAVALTAALGVVTPAVLAAGPKAVVIVGPVEGQTSNYRSSADVYYNRLLTYTSNVTRIYSPNATVSAVKTAIQGASIVIYLGHGNGWPSPYGPFQEDTKDGFGLNATAGSGDSNVKYYGANWIRANVKLAPNAVVLLNRLCYASGNDESGGSASSVSVAQQRVDNYGSGFLQVGAGAVIADAVGSLNPYIDALFTTTQSINQIWRAVPNFNNRVIGPAASTRVAGAQFQLDPDSSQRYYRSVVGNLALTAAKVTGASYAATGSDPASFVVPGNAQVIRDAAGLYPDADLTPNGEGGAPAALPLDTRVKVLAGGQSAGGAAVFQVQTFDGAASGWMAAADLAPRDSTAPVVWDLSTDGPFSPNGDGQRDTLTVNATLSEAATWQLRIWTGTTDWFTATGEGSSASATWDGRKGGATAPDGTYKVSVRATDAWGNAGQAREATFVIDTAAPQLSGVTPDAVTALTFTPNADGKTDTYSVGWTTTKAGAIEIAIKNAAGSWVRTTSTPTAAGSGSWTWDGKSNTGVLQPDGAYTVRLRARDAAGNTSDFQYRQVNLYAALANFRISSVWWYPQDRDRLAKSTTLSFTLVRPATVTWTIRRSSGPVVRTLRSAEALPAGNYSFTWDGTDDNGAMVPGGLYASVVSATDGVIGSSQAVSMELNAFAFRVSNATPARGQTITVTGILGEPVKGNVYLHVYQPGIGVWSTTMTKATATSYKASIKLRSSSTGTMKLRISALDADGRWQATYLSLPLR